MRNFREKFTVCVGDTMWIILGDMSKPRSSSEEQLRKLVLGYTTSNLLLLAVACHRPLLIGASGLSQLSAVTH